MTRQAKMTAPLDDRIAVALIDSATPDTVAALIEETESAARSAGERQQHAVSRLRERLTELQSAEEDGRRRVAYEEPGPSATNWPPSSPGSNAAGHAAR